MYSHQSPWHLSRNIPPADNHLRADHAAPGARSPTWRAGQGTARHAWPCERARAAAQGRSLRMWSMVGLVVLANLVLLGVLGFGLRRSGGVASIFQRGVRGPPAPCPTSPPLGPAGLRAAAQRRRGRHLPARRARPQPRPGRCPPARAAVHRSVAGSRGLGPASGPVLTPGQGPVWSRACA